MLLAREIERFQSDGRLFVTRLTIELLRPVGRTPLAMRCRLVRPGRKVQLIEASLWSEETEVARATPLRIRRATIELPQTAEPPPHPLPETSGGWAGSYRPGPAYQRRGVGIRTSPEGRSAEAPVQAAFRLTL